MHIAAMGRADRGAQMCNERRYRHACRTGAGRQRLRRHHRLCKGHGDGAPGRLGHDPEPALHLGERGLEPDHRRDLGGRVQMARQRGVPEQLAEERVIGNGRAHARPPCTRFAGPQAAAGSGSGAQIQHRAGLRRARNGPPIPFAELRRAPHQGRIGGRERLAVQPHIVFQSRPHMPTLGDAPLIQHDLVAPDPGGAPVRVRQQPLHRSDVEIKRLAVHRHRILHAHHELDM